MQTFIKDQIIYRGEVALRVVRPISDSEVQLEELATGQLSNHMIFNLLAEYSRGELLTVAQRKHQLSLATPRQRKPARMDNMSAAAKQETHRRIDYLVRLNRRGAFERCRKDLRKDIAEIAADRGEARAPHISTVYRWRRRLLKAQQDVRSIFCKFDKQGGRGQGRLDPEVEAILHEKIETVWLASKRCSAEDVHSAVFLEIQKANTLRVESEWLKVPGLRTIQRRLSQLYAFEVAVARFGTREAERMFATHLGARRVSRILELVEIDHTPLDIMVTDENRIVIGRPTATVLLDRHSRCCLGYALSLAGHGVPTVFAAIKHALLPKSYLRERYADLDLEWPCFGWMELLLADNGREFHAEAVADAMLNIGVMVEFAKSRDPNDKPHVERFLKTLNYSFIHRLPGTTLAKVHQRIGFKAEDEAAITMEELDRMLHVWICSIYHLRPHGGLDGRTPLAVWNESARAHPPQLKSNRADLDIEFAEICPSQLQHYGIELNTFVYNSALLQTLRRMLPSGPSVTVKWPRDDVGHIWVWDAIEEEYMKVPNLAPEYAGLTLAQAKAAKKAKASGDPSYQQTRAEAGDIVSSMVAEAMSDKKLKNRRKGARMANKTSTELREPVQDKDLAADILPLQRDAAPTTEAAVDDEVADLVVEERHGR